MQGNAYVITVRTAAGARDKVADKTREQWLRQAEDALRAMRHAQARRDADVRYVERRKQRGEAGTPPAPLTLAQFAGMDYPQFRRLVEALGALGIVVEPDILERARLLRAGETLIDSETGRPV